MKEKLLLTFALLLTAVTGAWALTPKGDDVWNETTKTLTVNSNPEANAYSGKTEIQHLVIASGVTGIGNCAFLNCTGLTTVTIGTGVTYIGIDAFYNCTNVTDVYCNADPEKLTWDESNCDDFKPDGTTIIHVADAAPWYTKFGCEVNGTFIDTPYVPLSWNYDADTNTLTLSGTVIPSYDDPDECPWKDYVEVVENIVINEGVRGIGNNAFEHYESLTTVTIPAGVTTIGKYAFCDCTGLTTVTIPASVTSIGMFAFYDCYSLTTVTIGSGVTYIGYDAFYDCTNVEVVYCNADPEKLEWEEDGCNDFKQDGSTIINVADAAPWIAKFTDVVNGTFSDTPYVPLSWNYDADTKTLTFRGTAPIPSYDYPDERPWYSYATEIETVMIEDGVTSIGDHAFEGCIGLTTVTIPASVTTIGDFAFLGCDGLTTVTFATGSKLETIGVVAFSNCFNLATVTIPASVTTIGDFAFLGCESLTTVTVYAPDCTLGVDAFDNCGNLANIYVFSDRVEYYKGADNWSAYEGIITEMPNPNGKCGENVRWVLTGESSNYTLTISGTGAMADYVSSNQPWKDYRSSIKTVVIGNGVTTIGNLAFGRCTGLTSINIPSSVTSIGSYAFYNTNLTSIEIPASVTSIDYEAFSGCTGLTSVTFATGSQLTSIGDATFQSCSSLTSIEIPASVENIGDYAFDNCSSLTSIEIPASVENIGDHAFDNCSNLTSIEIPASVENIGDHAFDNCSNLATVTVYAPDCTLGGSAFSGCNKLTNIYVLSNKVVSYKSAWSAYAEKISVIFDGTSTTTVNFDNDVTVNGVLYNRTFTASKPSTVMLPFSKAVGDISGGTFYTFGGVQKENDKWVATMNEVTGSIEANTPYLFMPAGTSMTFTGGATLNTTNGGNRVTADPGSHWTFKGTYEYKEWISGGANAEEIGKAYGFAGVAKTGIEVGDFVKVASGAKIRPMGCYLLWSDTPNASRAAARGAATEELPQSITVRLVSADGEVTGIGEIDTKTGEMTFDSEAWYTLNGVRLSGKPTKKGLYINNGKKVVIK